MTSRLGRFRLNLASRPLGSSSMQVTAQRALALTSMTTGRGIPEADRTRVLEPCVLSEESAGGAGLGLALVHRVVTQHGGNVRALQSPLGGARFHIEWPPLDVQDIDTSEIAPDAGASKPGDE